ncbi:SPOR domain-containing protein [Candidatus Marithioploca araucensis]|uniref:SPOR domain-containing protein n=1 Tax=Candidatus Marithioploca araucensis TaxID=70273 RepID=A0ABT7VQ99_9GAMM|nr:SPOR domain-containing protein [Candidatus Marithioploca araucensis]
MPLPNTRRTATENYDPKQRITGGIVLFLIMLLTYSILKIVLGFSSAPKNFKIAAPLDIERISVVEAPLTPTYRSSTPATPTPTPTPISIPKPTPTPTPKPTPTSTTIIPSQQPQVQYRLPSKFVFLDLNANPMQPEELYQEEPPADPFQQEGEKKWYVQAATLRTQEQAESLVQRIKDENIASQAYIAPWTNKNGTKWYIVRLPPQGDREQARQQYRQLRRRLRIRGAIKKLN